MIVYKVTNKINGKVYIGITTKTLEYRRKVHERDSKRYNYLFYRALKKYGFDNFEWEVIDTAQNIEELERKEKEYILLYESFNNPEKGYNSTSGVNSHYQITDEQRKLRSERAKGKNNPMYGTISPLRGKKFSEEHKRRISESLSKADRPHLKGSSNPSARRVINLDTGKIFDTIKEASEFYSANKIGITAVCKGKQKTCGGYRWKYID